MTTDTSINEHTWPDALVDAAEVRDWIAYSLPGRPRVSGPLAVYQAKEWGVTARFGAASQTGAPGAARAVVFKANLLPLFRDAPHVESLLSLHCPGAVPELLAWKRRGAGVWTLYSAFAGVSVALLRDMQPLLATARALANIQTAIAALPASELAPLPRVYLRDFPDMFDAVLSDLRTRQLSFWRGEGRALAAQFALPDDTADQMARYRDAIPRWADELDAGGWPVSLDHVDLQAGNAVLQSDGRILIHDWEEANLSSPFFSLDLLLDDAQELAGDEGERDLRAAYLDALPWSTPVARERALDLALCLSPLKHAYEALRFAEALGWLEGAPHITAWALARALPRWQSLAGTTPAPEE